MKSEEVKSKIDKPLLRFVDFGKVEYNRSFYYIRLNFRKYDYSMLCVAKLPFLLSLLSYLLSGNDNFERREKNEKKKVKRTKRNDNLLSKIVVSFWWTLGDSNPRPPARQAGALPAELNVLFQLQGLLYTIKNKKSSIILKVKGGLLMDFSNRKLSFFKAVDRAVAVSSSILTAAYLSALIFLVMSEKFGNTRVIAIFTRMFPSRELESVALILVGLIVAGAITMWGYSDNKLAFLLPLNAALSVLSAVFFLYYTKLAVFIAVIIISAVYLVLSILRIYMLYKKFDSEPID